MFNMICKVQMKQNGHYVTDFWPCLILFRHTVSGRDGFETH